MDMPSSSWPLHQSPTITSSSSRLGIIEEIVSSSPQRDPELWKRIRGRKNLYYVADKSDRRAAERTRP